MQRTCIVTDSTAIFTETNLPGKEHLYVIQHQIKIGDKLVDDTIDISLLKDLTEKNIHPRVQSPSVDTFQEKFLQLAGDYQEVVVILLTSHLNPSIYNAQQAISKMKSPAPVYIIDSQTTATGLGVLVQAAARASAAGMSGVEVHRIVRGIIRHIYAIFCLPDLKFLHHTGILDPAQAIIGEMLKITPFYILESGKLIPVQKARSSRHMVDILQEFIAEFDYLNSLSLIIGLPAFENESRNLKERINQYFPKISFGEYKIGAALGSILGPNCLGLIAIDEGIEEFLI
jgi:DegV family protein with EDD domain